MKLRKNFVNHLFRVSDSERESNGQSHVISVNEASLRDNFFLFVQYLFLKKHDNVYMLHYFLSYVTSPFFLFFYFYFLLNSINLQTLRDDCFETLGCVISVNI